jgi:hypothetical protein
MRRPFRSAVAGLVSLFLLGGLGAATPAHAAPGATSIWAWGDNDFGLIGDGTKKQRLTPTGVPGLPGVSSITPDARTAYAVSTDGTVWRWGSFWSSDSNGGGTDVLINTPTQVAGLSGVKSIALEQFRGYAVTADGTVWGWQELNAPAQVAGLSGVASISLDISGCGGYALKQDGTVWQFRCSDASDGEGVAAVGGADHVTSLTSGKCSDGSDTRSSWYAVKSDGTVLAWGDNRKGQLGDGTQTDRAVPVLVSGAGAITKVATSSCAAFAVTTAGAVWAWGANEGQLGDGTKTNRATPVRLTALSRVTSVSASGSYPSDTALYAVTSSGAVYYWGCGWPSHNGNVAEKYYRCGKTPVQMPGLSNVRAVVPYGYGGSGRACTFAGSSADGGGYAIKNDGSLWVWSGHATALSRNCGGAGPWPSWTPVQVSGLSDVTAVFAYPGGAYAVGAKATKAFTKAAKPKISGTAKVGKLLKAKVGKWSPKPRFAYQWLRNGQVIPGATRATYRLVGADAGKKISVTVAGSKAGYKTAAKTSAKTKAVTRGKLIKKTPRITGAARVGQVLTATSASWGPAVAKPQLSYQWYRNGKKIPAALGATYQLLGADQGKRITVKATGTVSGYTTATSKASKAVKPRG